MNGDYAVRTPGDVMLLSFAVVEKNRAYMQMEIGSERLRCIGPGSHVISGVYSRELEIWDVDVDEVMGMYVCEFIRYEWVTIPQQVHWRDEVGCFELDY